MLFSERKGYKPVRSALQRESIDEELRTGLWNAFYRYINWKFDISHKAIVFNLLWQFYFIKPINEFPYNYKHGPREKHINQEYPKFIKYLQNYFNESKWYELYDIIEFTLSPQIPVQNQKDQTNFKDELNYIMKKEMAAYRVVGNQVVEITSEEEIACIEEVLDKTNNFKGVNSHLKSALEHLSDRENPDFRNSIKESISAVEGIAQLLTGDPKVTLGAALKVLEKNKQIHPALKKSFSSLYGYTSDADGIRHSLLDEPSLTFDDAKFMLVSCTSFINYLIGKAAEQGISLS